MKKLLLFFIVLIQLTNLKAQSWVYHPFPSDSVTWMQEHVNSDGMSSFYRTYMISDTTIGAFNYKKVYTTGNEGYFGAGGYQPGPYYPNNLIGALRQDIPAKKVYFFDKSKGLERLLYDFSLPVGAIAFIDSSFWMPDTVKVSGIDSVIIGGNYHKKLILTGMHEDDMGLVAANWIEGAGSEAGPLERYRYGFEFSNQLDCQAIQNVRVYPYNSLAPYNCYYALGIGELKDNKIEMTVMPNPVAGQVQLNVNCTDRYDLEVRDSKGQLVLEKKGLQLNDVSVDFSERASGIYFIRIINKEGQALVKKVLKE